LIGLVGVEVAGEIITKYPMKNVFLIDSNSQLLKKLKKSTSSKIQQYLEKMGIKVFLNERLVKQDPENSAYITNTGRVFNADFCYYATGIASSLRICSS
jgi:NADH dehydrogenase FAD-containing subunit